MKKLLLIALVGIFLLGCQEDDNSDDTNTSGSSFSVTIDGTKWSPVSSTGISTMNIITITSLDTKTQVSITLPQSTTKGDYTIGMSEIVVSYNKLDVNQSFVSTSGKVTISSNDVAKKKISGTFDVTVSGVTGSTSTHALKGSFSVSYSNFGFKK